MGPTYAKTVLWFHSEIQTELGTLYLTWPLLPQILIAHQPATKGVGSKADAARWQPTDDFI